MSRFALVRLVGPPVFGASLAGVAGLGAAALALLLLQGLGRSPLQPGVGALAVALVSLVPAALEVVLPVGVLAGSAVVGARLAERSALLGLAACGVRLRRLVLPLFLVGSLWAGLHAAISHQGAPRGRSAARQALQAENVGLRLRPGEPTVVGKDQVLLRAGAVSPEGWSDVFVATDAFVAAAESGRMGAGRLLLEAGEAAPVSTRDWTLRFGHAELRVAPEAPRVELDERSSPHLRALVDRMQHNGRPARSESLVWSKRFTLPAMVPVLVLCAFAAGARTRRPGAVVAGFAAVWWVGLRLVDKVVDLIGVGAAAALPVVVVVALAVLLWRTWRLA